MQEQTIIQLIALGLFSVFGILVLRMWYTLKVNDAIARKVHGLITEVSKLKGAMKHISSSEVLPQLQVPANIAELSFEEAAKQFGLSEKDINNPIMRPLLEKIYAQLVAEAQGAQQKTEVNEFAH